MLPRDAAEGILQGARDVDPGPLDRRAGGPVTTAEAHASDQLARQELHLGAHGAGAGRVGQRRGLVELFA
jgi:hypothetical protein